MIEEAREEQVQEQARHEQKTYGHMSYDTVMRIYADLNTRDQANQSGSSVNFNELTKALNAAGFHIEGLAGQQLDVTGHPSVGGAPAETPIEDEVSQVITNVARMNDLFSGETKKMSDKIRTLLDMLQDTRVWVQSVERKVDSWNQRWQRGLTSVGEIEASVKRAQQRVESQIAGLAHKFDVDGLKERMKGFEAQLQRFQIDFHVHSPGGDGGHALIIGQKAMDGLEGLVQGARHQAQQAIERSDRLQSFLDAVLEWSDDQGEDDEESWESAEKPEVPQQEEDPKTDPAD